MTKPLKFLRRPEDVLSLMRESPSTRYAITTPKHDLEGRAVRAVVDCPEGEILAAAIYVILAYIAPGSDADRLFLQVMNADATPGAAEAWARLPLRYHAFNSACLLPEHPDAPRQHGGLVNDTHQAALENAWHVLTHRRKRPQGPTR